MIAAGDIVRHARYGRGRVEVVRHAGFDVLVAFDSMLRLWIRADDLEPVDRSGRAKPRRTALEEAEAILDQIMGDARKAKAPVLPAVADALPQTDRRMSSDPALRPLRLALEAFRLGIVPAGAAREWTVGRDEEVRTVFRWLNDPASGSLVVEGAYGSGKSHILEVLRTEALDRNWAVAMVGIDPTDAPAGFPKRVWRHAMRDLRVPVDGQILGLEGVMDLLSAMPVDPVADHPVWSVVHGLWTERPKLRPSLLAYLLGRPTRRRIRGLPNLPDHTTAANVYCNLLSALSSWLSESLGLEGLTLLIDEAEMSRTYRYAYEWSRGVNFFNGLAWVADDDDILDGEEVVRRTCYRGRFSGLVYSGFLQWPYLWRIPSRFKVVFAFTPGYTRFFEHVHAENLVRLELPSMGDLMTLFDRLGDAGAKLYGVPAAHPPTRACARALVDAYGHSFRMLIKGFLELIDHRRFYPDEDPDALMSRATGTF